MIIVVDSNKQGNNPVKNKTSIAVIVKSIIVYMMGGDP